MLNITIKNAKKVYQFTQILQNLKGISNELNLVCKEDGLYAQGMDSSHICLFEMCIHLNWFDTYECTEECVMGIHCEMLFKIISCMKEGQYIDMRYDADKNGDKLMIDLLGISYDKSFELSLIDIESDMVELPEKEYTADMKFISKDFSELISQLSIFGDKLKISCNDNIVFNSENEFGKVDITVKEEDIVEYMIEEDQTIESSFGIKFISTITKFSNLNKILNINISEQFPVKISYNLDDWKDENTENDEEEKEEENETNMVNYISFYLAPLEEDC